MIAVSGDDLHSLQAAIRLLEAGAARVRAERGHGSVRTLPQLSVPAGAPLEVPASATRASLVASPIAAALARLRSGELTEATVHAVLDAVSAREGRQRVIGFLRHYLREASC